MSSVNLDVFRKFREFGQSQNWGIFLQKTHKNTPGNCKGRLPAYRRAWFPSDLRFVKAGTESRLSGSDWGKLGENAKMKWNEDSGTVCRMQQRAYLRLAIIVISIDGGVLKRKIQVYIFRTLQT